jgi:hypothetical protein
MTISRTPSSRLDPAAVAAGDGASSSQGTPSGAGQSTLPSAHPGLHTREPSFAFAVDAGGLPPRTTVPEIVEVAGSSTPEHDRQQMLRTGERSESSMRRLANAFISKMDWGAKFLDPNTLRIASSLGGSAREGGEANSGTPTGRAFGHAPTFSLPPPERNWRSVAADIVKGTAQVGVMAGKELLVTGQALGAPLVSGVKGLARTAGPAAGHLFHQALSVGLPTVAREMVAAAVMHGMRNTPPETAFAVQGAVGGANLILQVVREMRERRHPDAAARGFHSLSREEWAAKTPAEQAAMIKHTQKVSRAITVAQVAASGINLAMMMRAHSHEPENKAAMLRPLATEVKVGLYASLRDAAQASFNVVGFDDEKDKTSGLAGNAFNAARATYAGVLTTADILTSATKGVLVPHSSDAMGVLLGTSQAMSSGDAWRTMAKAAGVSAVSNTVVEATDWFHRMHYQLSQNAVPPPQELKPALTGDDLSRVFDQGQSRTALINGLNSALSVLGLAIDKAPPALQGVLGSAGAGAIVFLTDSPITGNWQAAQGVRIEVAELSAQKKEAEKKKEEDKKKGPVDLEAGLQAAGGWTGAAGAGATDAAGASTSQGGVDSPTEGNGRLTGLVPGSSKSPGRSFRRAEFPSWPARSSGGNSSAEGSRHDRSNTPSDDERRSGDLVRRSRTAVATPVTSDDELGRSTRSAGAKPSGSSSAI